MCFTGDDGYATVYETTQPVARKQYRCCECGGPIPPGTKHDRLFMVFDGDAGQYRAHLECIALWEWAIVELCGNEGTRAVGDLRNELGEYGWYGDEGDSEPGLMDILDAVREGYERMSIPGKEGR